MANSSFWDKESICNLKFQELLDTYGAVWHYCTPGHLNASINIFPEDYDFSVCNTAISAAESGATVIIDAHMSNHHHTLLAGSIEKVRAYEECFVYREDKYLKSIDRYVDLTNYRCPDPLPVTDLRMIRNEIVYIARNPYVADSRFTPYSYKWAGGYVYFNPAAQAIGGVPFNSLKYRDKRLLSYRTSIILPDKYKYNDGIITQASYMEYEIGQAMFRDANHYFSALSKNIEAYSESAKRAGDSIILTYDEMFSVICMIANRDFGGTKPHLLPPNSKIEIAKRIHNEYNASNSQIHSLLNLPMNIVDDLFPLSSKK